MSEKIISDLKIKFKKFIEEQKGLPQEYNDIVNDNFWDLIIKQPEKKLPEVINE